MRNLLFLLFISNGLLGQSIQYPQDEFISPLDIPLFLSGNFGELRSNHFHAGLDIKTQGVEGKKVYAIADGYISRIKVSPYGYGNAIYVTHPNGYTSVYGHLKKFNDKIQAHVKAKQYHQESFSIQLFPSPFEFQVKQGEIIAYSGNTGGSGGPHLHFEIRDTKSEHPINPLFFGFDIEDRINPDIYSLMVYPLSEEAHVARQFSPKRFKAAGRNGQYHLVQGNVIEADGKIGLGIHGVDRMNGTGNSYGLHRIEIWLDHRLYFAQQINEFAFHEGRYINSHIDYEHYIRHKRRIQKSFVDPGNRLRIYEKIKNDGSIQIKDDSLHSVKYKLIDINGNASSLKFQLIRKDVSSLKRNSEFRATALKYFRHDEDNRFTNDEMFLQIPAHSLYKDIYFQYRKEDPIQGSLSPIYWLHEHYTPLHSYMTLSIKGETIPDSLRKRALIFSTTDGKSKYAEGGTWKGDNISVKTRSFGGYGIAIDTVAPRIVPINISTNANMKGKWSIQLKVTDDFSGLKHFRGEIDGKWVLFEYDAKKNLLTYFFDDQISPGKHQLEFTAKDGVGNKNAYKINFYR